MTTFQAFPNLPGLEWSVKFTPKSSTRVQRHVSGRSVRLPLYANALYEIELSYSGLNASNNNPRWARLGANSLQTLEGFFVSMQGQAGAFTVDLGALTGDPLDSSITGANLGTGNDSTVNFTLLRPFYGFAYAEPAGWVPSITQVQLSGTVQSGSAYGLTAPNILTFGTAPASGKVVTATYPYRFICAFSEDTLNLENFMYQLWQAKSVKLETLRYSDVM